jgi:hypothetical protein
MTERNNSEHLTLDRLLHPANAYIRPADALRDSHLTTNEKDAIPASWASDARVIEASPELRGTQNDPLVYRIVNALNRWTAKPLAAR